MDGGRVLLPKDVKPVHYRVHLSPNFETFNYGGQQDVNVKVLNPTNSISVNVLEIDIHTASVSVGGQKKDATIALDSKLETATFTFGEALPVGDHVLSLTFTGKLNDNLAGFYRSKNVVGDQTQWLATTQFEPADARKAFPCWDEPAIKATFTIVLTAPIDMTVLSNMPAVSTKVEGASQTVEFAPTPIVSTYLIAFCVGHFECVENVEKNYKVWTTPGKKEMGRFALDCGVKILDYFADYYGIPYPLPKTDMIAIPDFAAGAMENWGLITYRETALLCSESSSVAAKSRVAYVVAHELAHQWFGNLVTMEWWKELWLNEGFATFVGTQACAHFFPEWEVWKQFICDYIHRAFKADSLRNSHPIEVDVNEARKIDEIFDEISYSKGASVIRMISDYLGETAFRKGLNIYLNRFKYSNAVTEDLWQALSEGSGKDVNKVMDNWIKKMGYPCVSIEETAEPGKFKVSQQRFFQSGLPTAEEDSTVWTINMAVVSASNSEITYVDVTEKSQIISVNLASADEWVKFNAGQSGLYRIKYSTALAKRLGDALQSGALGASDRLGLVEDAFALAFAGLIPLSEALELTSHYHNETEYTVWSNIATNLGICCDLFDGTESAPLLSKFILNLTRNIRNLGWEPKSGEKDLDKLLRTLILNLLGAHGCPETIAEAKKRFDAIDGSKPAGLPADLASVIFKLAVKNGDDSTFERMTKIYEQLHLSAEAGPELRVKALFCTGFVPNAEATTKAINWALKSEHVRSQDLMYPFASCSSSAYGREATWAVIKATWDDLKQKFSGGSFLLGRIIKCLSGFNTEERAKEVEEFFAGRTEPNTERTLAQTLESIRTNAKTLSVQKESTLAWLKQHSS